MRLYYMTTAEVAINHILPENRLRYSQFDRLNDPFELLATDMTEPDDRYITELIYEKFVPRYGLICLGKHWESPVMWGHYANGHTGICLGFDVDRAERVRPVTYTPHRIKLALDRNKPLWGITDETFLQAISTKYSHWEYEGESRVFGLLNDPDPANGEFYLELDSSMILREVILGHRCKASVEAVAKVVHSIRQTVTVFKAKPALNSFTMIREDDVPTLKLWPQYAASSSVPQYHLTTSIALPKKGSTL